ncbi:MAG: MFS transporter, partial [Octadecabacter sp.]
LAGSGLLVFGGWRVIFGVMASAAALGLVGLTLALPETLAPSARVPVNLRSLLRGAKVLVRDPVFMGLTMIGAFGMSSFFVFISNASFVYTNQFGLTPTQFSIAFAINAIGFFSASQCAAPLGGRFGMVRVMRLAIIGFAAATCTLLVVVAAGFDSLAVVVVGLMLANACLGLVIPTTMVMALDAHGHIAGLASSMGGTIQMVMGGAMMALASLFFNGTTLPMIAAIALCAVLAFATSTWVMGRVGQPNAAQ